MEQKEISIKLFNENDDFSGECGTQCNDYIDKINIIVNKNNNLKLNYKMVKMIEDKDVINYNNYDFSDKFINIKVIISLLEFFNLTKFNTHEIYEFFKNNKKKYNIWKYIYNSEHIHCQTSSNYEKFVILRNCLSYSWEECLYDLLKECLNNNRCYKTFIWLDIFCVNQFNEKIKSEGLNNIDHAYHIADVYNISSFLAFERYWCCYEMSLKKKSIDGTIINCNNDLNTKITNVLNNLFNSVFNNSELLYNENCNKYIYKYILEFQKIKEFDENRFNLENAKITYDKDKYFIQEKIINRYGTIYEYEKRMNIYIYLIKYRDDRKYVYLANRIMEL